MANDFYAQLDGIELLFRELYNMGVEGEKASNKALKAGGKVFLKLMKQKVPYSDKRGNKHLRDALAVSGIKKDDTGNPYVSVGTYLGNGQYRNGVYWGHIINGGHVIKSSSNGKVIGYVAARPFMQEAFEQGQNEATQAVGKIVFEAMGL